MTVHISILQVQNLSNQNKDMSNVDYCLVYSDHRMDVYLPISMPEIEKAGAIPIVRNSRTPKEGLHKSKAGISLLEIVLFYIPAVTVKSYPYFGAALFNILDRMADSKCSTLSPLEIAPMVLQYFRRAYSKVTSTTLSLQDYFLYSSDPRDIDERMVLVYVDMTTAKLLADIYIEAKLLSSQLMNHCAVTVNPIREINAFIKSYFFTDIFIYPFNTCSSIKRLL